MPSQKLYLDEQKTNEIIVSWRGIWKDITVTHNGTPIGGFDSFRHLKEGGSFMLSDGSRLDIFYSNAYGDQGLRVSHNGRPVKGSSGDPEAKLKGIFGLSCFIGGLSFIIGALGQFASIPFLERMGANWIQMIVGLIVIGLGYVVMRSKSTGALIGIILILVLDIIATVYVSVEMGGRMPSTGIGLKILFIIQFARGFKAISQYKAWELEEQNAVPRSPFQ